MRSSVRWFILTCYIVWYPILSRSQESRPVLWHFSSAPVSGNEVILIMTANVGPDWHLYSQFLGEGGPMPTRFVFTGSDDYVLMGKPEEKGNPVKFYDNIYEMEVTWYSGQVSFLQRIRITRPQTTIRGVVEYMTCNAHLCIPDKQRFSIDVNLLKKKP